MSTTNRLFAIVVAAAISESNWPKLHSKKKGNMAFKEITQQRLLRRVLRIELWANDEYREPLIRLALDDEVVFATLYGTLMHQVAQFVNLTKAFYVSTTEEG